MRYNYILYRLRESKRVKVFTGIKYPVLLQGRGTPSRSWKWVLVERSEMTRADKVRDFIGWDAQAESSRVREPKRTALQHGLQCFYSDGISFWIVFYRSFWLRVLPGGAHLVQPRCMAARRILGGGWTLGHFLTFPELCRLVVAY